jgi:peptidylprolyl isomerase
MSSTRSFAHSIAYLFLFAATVGIPAVAAPGANGALIGRAGSAELTDSDLRRLLEALPEANRQQLLANPASLAQAVRGELLRRNGLAEAKAKGYDKDPSVASELERVRDELVLRAWVSHEAKLPAGYPADEDVQRAYATLRERASASNDYRLSQIYIATPDGISPEKLQAAFRKLSEVQSKISNTDFAGLAKTYSEHADSAAKGGDLGMLPESQLLPEIRAVLPTMKIGDTIGPVKTSQGLHFIRLTEKKPASVPPLAELRDALVNALRQEKTAELQQGYMKQLAQKYPPTINELEIAKLAPAAR